MSVVGSRPTERTARSKPTCTSATTDRLVILLDCPATRLDHHVRNALPICLAVTDSPACAVMANDRQTKRSANLLFDTNQTFTLLFDTRRAVDEETYD